MKKDEAKQIAPKVSNYVLETIEQLLSYPEKINGKINFTYFKINNQNMCSFDISVPTLGIDDHINSGITIEHTEVLYEQIFNDLLAKFLDSEKIGVGRYHEIKNIMGEDFTGMNYINLNGSKIALNFNIPGGKYRDIISRYTERIKIYEESMKNKSVEQQKYR